MVNQAPAKAPTVYTYYTKYTYNFYSLSVSIVSISFSDIVSPADQNNITAVTFCLEHSASLATYTVQCLEAVGTETEMI